MKIAVVDDERPARSELIYLIRQCISDAEIFEAVDSESLLQHLETECCDVCFLDINLEGTKGTTLASMARSKCPEMQVIFATAYADYAVKAFDLGVCDYLLKPFDLERVRKALGRVGEQQVKNAAGAVSRLNRLMVSTGTGYRVLCVHDIIYIETENRACRINTSHGSYIQNESLNYFESRLREQNFFRIHKSFLVNLEEVQEMVPIYNGGYGLRMKNLPDRILPIGRTQLKDFRRLFEQ